LYINNVEPAYLGSEDAYNLRKKMIFQRLTDVVVTLYSIEETVGDVLNFLGSLEDIDDMDVREIEEIMGLRPRTETTSSSSSSSDESSTTNSTSS